MKNLIMKEIHVEALFASDLQPSQNPAPEQVRGSVAVMLRRYGRRWCAARLVQEYGEHPDTAIERMVWAVRTISDCYPDVRRYPSGKWCREERKIMTARRTRLACRRLSGG
jgi:hypothetical protein